ncbi:MAG: hypothetical protein VB099_20560 [Candidatus Limiplasma sp.]|nr:hypothetical protein [Candidatus Limiplasma sp.]
MLDVSKLIASFEEIIGWPYENPGSNDSSGIDCSGAFVRAFRLQGANIYHGSNTIFRQYCSQTGQIAGVGSLVPGMAVFKQRKDNGEPDKYRGDGIGNLYHIGLVASINPLRIIHATSPNAKVDTKLGNWSYWGLLKNVEYGGVKEMPGTEEVRYIALVVAPKEDTVNLRKTADGALLARVPVGQRVSVLAESGGWTRCVYGDLVGYMQTQYLKDVESVPDGGQAGSLFSLLLDELSALVEKYGAAAKEETE